MPCGAADVVGDEDDAQRDGEMRQHRRGMTPYVFVPWQHVNSSALNLPVHQMDYFVPG
jgi:F-box protein 9